MSVKYGSGAAKANSRVNLSSAFTPLIGLNRSRILRMLSSASCNALSWVQLYIFTKSSATIGCPSCHLASSRTFTFAERPSFAISQPVASWNCSLPLASFQISRSNAMLYMLTFTASKRQGLNELKSPASA